MKSVIIGAGKYGEVYLSYLKESGVDVIGFLDDDTTHANLIGGLPLLGKTDILPDLREKFGVEAIYCPLGNNELRVKFLQQAKALGYSIPNFIHPSVIMSPNVKLGEGIYILLGSNIMPFTEIEDCVMISMNVNVAHHNILKKGTFLSTGCNFGASIVAEENTYCGIGSTIMTGLHRLGKDCLIGAGAVVIKDVPDGAVMAGVPAKLIKYKPGYTPDGIL
ncbi:MAG: acetyltransferase [Muribaculaceae bacterium]|nr:acetyltransferase [Muribaculaceae bacterium]